MQILANQNWHKRKNVYCRWGGSQFFRLLVWIEQWMNKLMQQVKRWVRKTDSVACWESEHQNPFPSIIQKRCDLVRNEGIKDSEFIKILQELPNFYEICIRYKRTEPKPTVDFSLGSYFNKSISIDIKEINGNKILQLINHGTRYSVRVRILSKESSNIISAIFKHWLICWLFEFYGISTFVGY